MINSSTNYGAAVRRQLSREVLPLVQRSLVAYQFATKKKMEKGAGVTWTATRFNRLPLPFAPLSEGVPPVGENLSISQVTGVALQWGDKVTLTDVAVTTTLYNLIEQARRLLRVQVAELHERNTYQALLGGTQVNYVNSRGSRALLQAGDVMDVTTINRTYADLENIGAPFYNGQLEPDIKRDITHGAREANKTSTMAADHYVAITSPLVEQDLRQNSTIVTAWSYSDHSKLYINEVGYWAGIIFTKSNMLPRWTGVALVAATGGTAGALATDTYQIQVTGTDTLNQFGEQLIYQITTGISVTGPTGSISLTMPSTAGYTYSVYVGKGAAPTQLGLSVSGPTSGPLSGNATQIAPSTAVVITGLGAFQIPPAAPATGVTVYPTFVFGQEYFACLQLEEITFTFLGDADKSDPINQLRVIGWKDFQGYIVLNQSFGARIESSVSNSGTFG